MEREIKRLGEGKKGEDEGAAKERDEKRREGVMRRETVSIMGEER